MATSQFTRTLSYYFGTFLSSLFGVKNSSDSIELRIALDVGSSSTKSKGIIYDTKSGKILKDLGEMSESMEYQVHLNETGNIVQPDFMFNGISKIMKIISYYTKVADYQFDNIKCAGIATAWARKASNIEAFIKILKYNGINISVISQEDEGLIGYHAASKSIDNLDNKSIQVLDIGGGSFQVVNCIDSQYNVFNGDFGSSNFYKAARSYSIEDDTYNSERFLNRAEVVQARIFIDEKVISSLQQHLESFQITECYIDTLAIGQLMTKGTRTLIDSDTIKLEEVSQLIETLSDCTLDEANELFPKFGDEYIKFAQTNMLLLEGIMKGLRADEIKLSYAKSVDYVANDQNFWDMQYLADLSEYFVFS